MSAIYTSNFHIHAIYLLLYPKSQLQCGTNSRDNRVLNVYYYFKWPKYQNSRWIQLLSIFRTLFLKQSDLTDSSVLKLILLLSQQLKHCLTHIWCYQLGSSLKRLWLYDFRPKAYILVLTHAPTEIYSH